MSGLQLFSKVLLKHIQKQYSIKDLMFSLSAMQENLGEVYTDRRYSCM